MSDKLENTIKDCFDENTFYIADAGDGVSLVGHKTYCKKCKRKILIQLPLFGVPHHFDAIPTCAECLEINDDFKNDHIEIANDLLNWKNESIRDEAQR